MMGCMGEDIVDHGARHVDAGGALDAFEARGAVDLQHHGTVLGVEHVDAGDVEPEDLGGVDRGLLVGGLQGDAHGRRPAVEVAAELPLARRALHGRHDLAADHDGAEVAPFGFLDEGLDEDVLAQGAMASRTDSADLTDSARMTPIPCVPSSSFRITGAPPTLRIAERTSSLRRAKAVGGMPMSWRERSCRLRSLSRLLEMPWLPLAAKTPIISNWRSTARP